jgi:hypothetical protein
MEAAVKPEPVSEAQRRNELAIAVQKVYLSEIATVYENVVARAGCLGVSRTADTTVATAPLAV